jgi:hypothetical protein
LQQYWTMRAGVFRLAMSHPGDVSAVGRPILTGAFRARGIAAVVGKSEGRNNANDFTHGHIAQSLTGALGRDLEEPAETSGTRVFVSGGAEHRGRDGGGPVAVICRRPFISRSTSCAS